MFYVYEWYNIDTNEIFYVGKGCRNRYKVRKHNYLFNYIIENNNCSSRIVKRFDDEKDAFEFEYEYINQMWSIGQCKANIYKGGAGGTTTWWTPEKCEKYSTKNIMKMKNQRKRMSLENPMKNKEIAEKVGKAHRKPFYIDTTLFDTINSACEKYNVAPSTISYWLKVGYNKYNEIVYYANTEKPSIDFTINRHITNNQKVKYDNKVYTSVKELSKALNINYTTLFNYYQKHKPYNNKYIEKI